MGINETVVVVETLTESALNSVGRTPLDLFCTPEVERTNTEAMR